MDFSSVQVSECSWIKAKVRSNENYERAFIFTVTNETNLIPYGYAFLRGFFHPFCNMLSRSVGTDLNLILPLTNKRNKMADVIMII